MLKNSTSPSAHSEKKKLNGKNKAKMRESQISNKNNLLKIEISWIYNKIQLALRKQNALTKNKHCNLILHN